MIQAFLFHQFALLLLLVPVVAAMALATHAVIGEKQAKALEPLLATPISTIELLAAKTLTPFVFALALTWSPRALYVAGIVALGEPGVWRALLGRRMLILFGDPRPARGAGRAASVGDRLVARRTTRAPRNSSTSLVILPITAVFIAQLIGAFIIAPGGLLLARSGCCCLNALLLWMGVQVFQRETHPDAVDNEPARLTALRS